MKESSTPPFWEVAYSDDYDEITGNILKVTPDFLSLLQNNESIVIEGREDEDFLFSIENNTYKLRDIFLPSTMLVTRELTEHQGGREVAYVSLETAHYLKLEAHNIEFHTIYAQLMGEAMGRELLEDSPSIQQMVIAAGINVSAVCSRFRVTNVQLEQLLRHAPVTVFHRRDLPSLEEPTIIIWGNDALLTIMRLLLPFLMELGVTGEWFTFDQVASLAGLKHERIMQMLAKLFEIEVEGSSDGGYGLSEPMEMEEAAPLRYKLKVQSIVRFVLMEHYLAKDEYSAKQMDVSLWNLILTYLPVGLPGFQEDKAKTTLQELLGLYFMTIQKQTYSIRVVYDPLYANSTIKDRLQFLRNLKKRFTLSELRGAFGKMARAGDIQLGDVLMKHFRKCGQQYELKLVIPK